MKRVFSKTRPAPQQDVLNGFHEKPDNYILKANEIEDVDELIVDTEDLRDADGFRYMDDNGVIRLRTNAERQPERTQLQQVRRLKQKRKMFVRKLEVIFFDLWLKHNPGGTEQQFDDYIEAL